MIELVERVNVQLSPDNTWYGIFRFKQITKLEDAEKFIEELKKVAVEHKLEISGKMGLQTEGEDWTLIMTFKGLSALVDAEGLMMDLKKTARSHKMKDQKTIDESR